MPVFGGDLPIGAGLLWYTTTAPTGWLLCDGSAVSRTTYAALFAVIGTSYGTGNGTTTFNLPDLRGRVAAGLDNMGGSDAGRLNWANTIGTTGGTQTHTLTESEMPSHTHIQNAHSHNMTFQMLAFAGYGQTSAIQGNAVSNSTNRNTDNTTATNQNTGGGAAHNIMQPTILITYIIKHA